MDESTKVKTARKSDRERLAEVDLDALSERELRDLYDEIFGEPSDEEFAQAAREAEAEYEAGDYTPTLLDEDDDDEPYREQTRQENLQSFKQSLKGALAGDTRPIEELFRELRES